MEHGKNLKIYIKYSKFQWLGGPGFYLRLIRTSFNPFQVNISFLHPLKTLKNQKVSDLFRKGLKNETLVSNGLRNQLRKYFKTPQKHKHYLHASYNNWWQSMILHLNIFYTPMKTQTVASVLIFRY